MGLARGSHVTQKELALRLRNNVKSNIRLRETESLFSTFVEPELAACEKASVAMLLGSRRERHAKDATDMENNWRGGSIILWQV